MKKILLNLKVILISIYCCLLLQNTAFSAATVVSTLPAQGATNIQTNAPYFRANFSFSGTYSPSSPTSLVKFKNLTTGTGIYEVSVSTNIKAVGFLEFYLPGPLPDNSLIEVTIAGHNFDLAANKIITFTTENTAPAISYLTPSPNTGILDTTRTFNLSFDQNIIKNTGNILFVSNTNTTIHSIDISSAAVSVNQKVATIKVPSNWTTGNQFKIVVPASGFKDATNLMNAEYTSPLYSVYDPSAPLAKIGQSPILTDTIDPSTTSVQIIFNKPILKNGAPSLTILKPNGSTQRLSMTGNTAVISNNILTITSPTSFWEFEGYYTIQLDASALKDAAGNVASSSFSIGFVVRCLSYPPKPAEIEFVTGEEKTCRYISLELSTSLIDGVSYKWTTTNSSPVTSFTNTFSFNYTTIGNKTLSVVTTKGPCISPATTKTIQVKTPMTVSGIIGGSQTIDVNTPTNYSLALTSTELNNLDSLKWYKDGVLLEQATALISVSWSTPGIKELKVIAKNNCGEVEKMINVAVGDVTPPSISVLNPLNNATGVKANANLVVTFSENIMLSTGEISIKKPGGTNFEAYTLPSANVSVSQNMLIINPTSDFLSEGVYYVNIASGAIKDLAGNSFAGISGTSTWTFTVEAVDTKAPFVLNFIPANNALNVPISTKILQINYSESVLEVKDKVFSLLRADNSEVVDKLITSDPNITFEGDKVVIKLNTILEASTSYYVTLDEGFAKDGAGNPSAGIFKANVWKFTTAPVTAIDDFSSTESDAIIWPNPFTEEINITNSNFEKIEIFNSAGVKVFESSDATINLNELNAGVYLAKIFMPNEIITKKIQKQ